MNKKNWFSLILVVVLGTSIYGHCQIPCGIYDDKRVISELYEHVSTIQKAVSEINKLSGKEEKIDKKGIGAFVKSSTKKAAKKAKKIAKDPTSLTPLNTAPKSDFNQIIRWVLNKEKHATKIQFVINDYFLAQRIKVANKPEDQEKYIQLLKASHKVIFFAMKVKQSSDLDITKKLKEALKDFESSYN